MLAPILHKHLDQQDSIDAESKAAVDKILGGMDIKALIEDPQQELGRVADEVSNLIIDKYQPLAHQEGVKLAEEVKKRDIKVDPSKDPTKNEGTAQ
jgi:hypothetical protein